MFWSCIINIYRCNHDLYIVLYEAYPTLLVVISHLFLLSSPWGGLQCLLPLGAMACTVTLVFVYGFLDFSVLQRPVSLKDRRLATGRHDVLYHDSSPPKKKGARKR
jgi:hypothetical protein